MSLLPPRVLPGSPTPEDAPIRVYDPGGSAVLEYCRSYQVVDEALLEFSTIVTTQPISCRKDLEFLQRRTSWFWSDALDPEERDSLVAINPGFIRYLYHQWSLNFMEYKVPVAVDLLSHFEPSNSPFNPIQLAIG